MSGAAQDLAGPVPDTSTETSTAGKQRAAGEALLRRMNVPETAADAAQPHRPGE